MAKLYKVVDPQYPSTPAVCKRTDWSACILCQENTAEILHCPAESKRNSEGTGYKTITDLLESFSAVGCSPNTINLSRLNDGEGIETTLRNHKA